MHTMIRLENDMHQQQKPVILLLNVSVYLHAGKR